MSTDGEGSRPTMFGRVSALLATVAGMALIGMVVLIAVGVTMRFLLRQPILGSNEIVQLVAVAVVMLALPYCTATDGHVRVDVLDAAIGKAGRLMGDIVSRGLSIFVLSILSWRAVLKGLDSLHYGDATNMLRLPLWPFYFLLALGVALAALSLLLQLLGLLARRTTQ
jgi:TRAP-type C4-dicarboxylate transport system permease small subunit